MKMTDDEKARAYRRVAQDAVDYIYRCADMGIRPLKHDANLFGSRLEQIRVAKIIGRQ